MYTVFLSPSNQSANRYAWGDTNEKVQCERIAGYCEIALTRCGIGCVNGSGMAYGDRISVAHNVHADLYMPIHTNASPKHNASGTRMFVRSMTETPSIRYCRTIFGYLDAACPGTSSNIKTYPSLWEFKQTEDIPAVYAECDFHDVASVAKYIVEHAEDIGEAIAHGICDCFGVKWVGKDPQLQVGDLVMLRQGATNYTGKKTFAKWVYRTSMYVRQINGDRVVISICQTGDVTGAVNIKDLTKI